MMAPLWDDILADVASAKNHFAGAVSIFDNDFVGKLAYKDAMAFQHAMQSGYTSFETALKRVLALLGEPLPVGSEWHSALLRRLGRPVEGVRPALLPADLLNHLNELRRFRHVAMHAYDDFEPTRAIPSVEAARVFLARIDGVIATFRAAIDPE